MRAGFCQIWGKVLFSSALSEGFLLCWTPLLFYHLFLYLGCFFTGVLKAFIPLKKKKNTLPECYSLQKDTVSLWHLWIIMMKFYQDEHGFCAYNLFPVSDLTRWICKQVITFPKLWSWLLYSIWIESRL